MMAGTRTNYRIARRTSGKLRLIELRRSTGKLICTVAGRDRAYGVYFPSLGRDGNYPMFERPDLALAAVIEDEDAASAADELAAQQDADEWAQARQERRIES